MIRLEKISKYFGRQQVLKEINLEFEDGGVYGIVGENGAGKTTLFRCMAGLEQYDGSIISTLTPLKNHLGWLPTDPFFFSRITGKEYLQFCCNARNVPLQDAESKNIFELPLNRYASDYSTGMKKKLALTAILLQENKYFILDEPYNGVDIQSNILITEIIQRLKALNKTVLIASHIFSTLEETCDAIHYLHQGSIVQSVGKDGFAALATTLKAVTLDNRMDKLDLH